MFTGNVWFLIGFIFIGASTLDDAKGEITVSDDLYTIPENCDFNTVRNMNNGSNECSPKLDDEFFSEFTGILINVPKVTVWPKEFSEADYPVGPFGETSGPMRLMVAGIINAPYQFLGLNGDFSDDIVVVAVNQKTAIAYSGKMPRADFLPVPADMLNLPKRPMSDADKEALISDHFNFDLVHDLDIPIADATYHIYATLGEYKSNVVTIKTSVEK
jgi:hypothetical protein